MKRSVFSVLFVAAIWSATMTSCKEDGARTYPKVDITGVKVVPPHPDGLVLGANYTLTAAVEPANATYKLYVSWSSENPDIAEVDRNGKVTAKSVGTAHIKATTWDGDFKDSYAVVVRWAPVTGVRLSHETLELQEEQPPFALTYTVEPATASKDVTWKSDAPGIVAVDEKGVVSALTEGIANITVTTVDGGHTATCAITVIPLIRPTGITISDETLLLGLDHSYDLTYTIEPEDAGNKLVTWESDDPGIVSVDENGKVTARNIGKATITVTTVDGGGHKDYCEVTVEYGNLLKNGSAEEQAVGSSRAADWTMVPATWFTAYYNQPHPDFGATVMGGGSYDRLDIPANSGNANFNFIKTYMDGNFVFRIGGAQSGGFYQIVDVIPGETYHFSAFIGMRARNGLTGSENIKDFEAVKFLSADAAGLTTYHKITLTDKRVFESNDASLNEINVNDVVIPAAVTQVRIQFDHRNFASPNNAPITLADKFVFHRIPK